MSVTYQALLHSVQSAFEHAAVELVTVSPTAPQRRSLKATAGASSRTTAVLVSLAITQLGPNADRGDNQTRGTLVFRMQPSKASEEVSLDALAALHEQGHRAVVVLDGKEGVRTSTVSTVSTPTGITFTVGLVFGHVVLADDPPNPFVGRA